MLSDAGDLIGVLAVARRVAGAQQGEGGDTGVGDIGRVGDVGPFDSATGFQVVAPAAALVPAAAGVLLVDKVGEPFVDAGAERFGFDCDGSDALSLAGVLFRLIAGPETRQGGERRHACHQQHQSDADFPVHRSSSRIRE